LARDWLTKSRALAVPEPLYRSLLMALHEKIDLLRDKQCGELIFIQQEQLRLLSELMEDLKKNQ